MDVKLVVMSGPTRTRALRLRAPVVLIGRQRGCGVRIASSAVSRRHCLLRLHDGCVTVEDLASANGTLLNGVPVTRAEVIRPGDRLQIGPVTFEVEYVLSPRALNRLLEEKAESGDLQGADLLEGIESVGQVLEVIEDLPVVEAADDEGSSASEDHGTDPRRPLPRASQPAKHLPPPKRPREPVPEELLPVADEAAEDAASEDFPLEPLETEAWSLPDAQDLREVLSGLDEPAPEPKPPPRPPRDRKPRKQDPDGEPEE